jgi:uncharacterized protein YprB with RNaseH-like and TPR domain
VEGDALVVRQFFLEDPGAEDECSSRRCRCFPIPPCSQLNGRAYDAPLLETRLTLVRLPSPLRRPHLDLLHAARSLQGDDARLLLRARRPPLRHQATTTSGALIEAYFAFQRRAEARCRAS